MFEVVPMCQQLSDLREAVGRFAKGFDARSLIGPEAARVIDDAAAIEAMVGAVKALAVARVDETKAWGGPAYPGSPADTLSKRTGISKGQARDILEAGRHLTEAPEVADAALAGKLSPAQATLIAGAAQADPAATPRLIQTAQDASLTELKDEVARTKAAVVDLEQRRQLIHRRRRLRAWTDLEGAWHLSGYGNPEDGAQIMAALAPIQNEIFHQARREGRRESPDAYAFDSLVQLAVETTGDPRHPAGVAQPVEPAHPADPAPPVGGKPETAEHLIDRIAGSPPPRGRRRRRRRGAPVKLLLRVDYDTWLRGVATQGETCELAGYGPIPLSVAHDLIQSGDPFVAAILTKGQKLVGVAHLGRQPTAHQQSALEWLYPACAVRGCPNRARLERDHEIDWSKTHFTMLDHLDLLCHHHHRQKTIHNWALIPGRGKRDFVPPEDPRHPRHHPGYAKQPDQLRQSRPTRRPNSGSRPSRPTLQPAGDIPLTRPTREPAGDIPLSRPTLQPAGDSPLTRPTPPAPAHGHQETSPPQHASVASQSSLFPIPRAGTASAPNGPTSRPPPA